MKRANSCGNPAKNMTTCRVRLEIFMNDNTLILFDEVFGHIGYNVDRFIIMKLLIFCLKPVIFFSQTLFLARVCVKFYHKVEFSFPRYG